MTAQHGHNAATDAPTPRQVRRLVDDPGKRLAIHVSPAVAVVLSSTAAVRQRRRRF